MNKLKTIKGQSLFEVVVALGVVTMIIVAIIILATNSIRNTTYSRNKTLSSRYAQEAVEWLRNEREKGNSAFLLNIAVPIYCFDNLSWTNAGVCDADETIAGTILKREAYFSTSLLSGKNIVEAVVVVSWDDSQGYHEVRNTTNFTDTREK